MNKKFKVNDIGNEIRMSDEQLSLPDTLLYFVQQDRKLSFYNWNSNHNTQMMTVATERFELKKLWREEPKV